MPTVPITITSFTGDFAFLHNSYPCEVPIFGAVFPSAEHAYQASKTEDENCREIIRNLLDGPTAKSYGNTHLKRRHLRPNWLSIREMMMTEVIQAKFFNNIPLAKMLAETGNSALLNCISGSDSLDCYWGIRGSKGENRLGVILMNVRTQIQEATGRAAATRLAKVKFSGVSLTPEPKAIESLVSQLEHLAANDPDREQSPLT